MIKTFTKYLPALIIAALLLPLLAMGYLGQYSRYIADDYCTTAIALAEGIFGSMAWWYTNWAGQFTNWMLKGIAAFLGPGLASALPTIILMGWVAAAAYAIYQLAQVIRLPKPRLAAFVFAGLIVYAVFAGTPSIIQSLYWIGAAIPYTLPLIFLTFLAGFLLHTLRTNAGKTPVSAIVVVALVTFFAGGLSEVYVALQAAALGLAFLGVLVFAPAPYKRPALTLLGVGIICSLAALVLIAVAPGNAVRRARFPTLPLTLVVWRTVYISISYAATAAGILSPIPLIVSVLLPMMFVYRLEALPAHLRLRPGLVRALLLLSALAAFVLIAACIAPPIYGTSYAPAARVYIMPQFILVVTAMFWGNLMGLGARRSQPRISASARTITGVVLSALLIIGPIQAARGLLADIPDYRAYAAEWDSRDQEIRAAAASGEREVETTMLTVDIGIRAGLEPIGPEAGENINTCAARYYGVDTLVARTLLQMGDKVR